MPDRGYIALCYHYVRPPKDRDPFPRILGNRVSEFRRHVEALADSYEIMTVEQAVRFSHEGASVLRDKPGILFTFDDGLADHHVAAEILAEYGIKGVFFVPTCMFVDGLPVPPVIIHYAIARYGIEKFLLVYRHALEAHDLSVDRYDIVFRRGEHDPWEVISKIKSMAKYRLPQPYRLKILNHIYVNTLSKEFSDALEIMHLTREQTRQIIGMGHALGTHSRSHLSMRAADMTESEISTEIIEPKHTLENLFGTSVQTFAYPYGSPQDCLSPEFFRERAGLYRLAFTATAQVNAETTSPFELGRYLVRSNDDQPTLLAKLASMFREFVA